MRLRFRTKLFLALVLTVLLLVGGLLGALEAAAGSSLKKLIESHVQHGERTLGRVVTESAVELSDAAGKLSQAQRVVSKFESRELQKGILQEALFEIEYRSLRSDLLVLADRDGAPLGRAVAAERKLDEVPDPVEPGPEARLIGLVLEKEEEARGQIEWRGEHYLALAVPVFDGASFVGVMVFGRRLRSLAGRVQESLDPQDDLGFRAGAALVGARHVKTSPQAPAGPFRDEDHPYFAVVRPAGPASAVLFISLQDHVQARAALRRMILLAGAAAVLASVVVSMLVARGVSKPVAVLVDGTRRLAEGAYGHRIDIPSRDEMGDLATAFNRMAGDLQTKEKVRGVLNKVVAREVADELLKGDLGLGGRTVRATLLFADLRGFTAMTQGMAPDAVVAMLNEFMTLMSREILAARGIVDKYVGDEIIGVFGAPKSYGRDALAAVEAACAMRRRLAELNERRRFRGEAPLAMGVGIHTGDVVAGCMGSEELMSYTCIGAAMNLAARLCSAAKPGQILISEDTRKELGDGAVSSPLPPIQVKGFDRPVGVHEVVQAEGRETARRQTEGTPR